MGQKGRGAVAALVVLAIVAWTAPLEGRSPAAAPRWQSQAVPPNALDPGFVSSRMGAVMLLPNHGRQSSHPGWLQFDTDACGLLQGMKDGRSTPTRSAFAGNPVLEEVAPWNEGRAKFGKWLSAHPEVAVIGNTIDKWCGADGFDGEDLDTPEIA